MVAPEKPELPAWLESLRAGEQPATSAGGPSNFTGPDLSDEGTLPGWMRSENAEYPETGTSGPYPAWRPASMPAPHTDGEFVPPRAIAASSLIDEQALPSWMQEPNPASQQSVQSSLSASSLVQPDSLPDWMRVLQSSPGSALPSVPPAVDPITPVQAIVAHDLIDRQALPPWLSGQSNLPGQAPQPYQQAPYQQASFDVVPKGGQPGLAASSLLDMNALPGWLRENEPVQGQKPISAGPGSMPFAQPGQAQPPNASGPLAAASLIDMNALPDWLRAPQDPGVGQQSGMPPIGSVNAGDPGANIGTRFNSFGPPQPPRAENMRVPSRPRGEMAAHEQSEVAANVFSSMLGVASAVPSFSTQPTGEAFGNSQGFSVGQSQEPISQMPQTQGYMGYQGGYGGYPMGNQPAWPQQPANGSNMSPMPMTPGQEQIAPSPGSKPARRGFLETIRSWFSR